MWRKALQAKGVAVRKKSILTVLIIGFVFSSIGAAYSQEGEKTLPDYWDEFFSEPIMYNFYINNEQADYSMGRPYINKDMIVMVPLRVSVEKMGYKVVWNNNIRTVIIYNDQSMYILKINRNRYYSRYNSSAVLSKEPVIRESRTYVPLEFFTTLMKIDAKIDSDGNLLIRY